MNTIPAVLKSWIPEFLQPRRVLLRQFTQRTAGQVIGGPFKGMHYVTGSVGSLLAPKLLGTYEQELHGVVEELIARAPDVIVDVGAGEGYYAVGLPRRLPQMHMVAFEMDPAGRELLARLAEKNGVASAVEIHGRCTAGELAAALQAGHRPCVIMDVEGYERELLDPGAVPGLGAAAILVELHAFVHADIRDLIAGRFGATHAIREIATVRRTRADYPLPTLLSRLMPARHTVRFLNEGRPGPMSWLWMTPRSSAAPVSAARS